MVGALQEADPRKALTTGLLVILVMPSGRHHHADGRHEPGADGLVIRRSAALHRPPVLVAALPLLGFLLFHHRAQRAMPKVRDWMRDQAWAVNVIVCAIFIVLILA